MGSTSDQLRVKIIAAYAECKTYKGAARKLGVSRNVVKHWVMRFKSTGGLARQSGSGGSRAISNAAALQALELLQQNRGGGSNGVAQELHSRGFTDHQVHRTTVVRAAKGMAKVLGTPIQAVRGKPRKMLTQDNKQKRLNFAKANIARDWKTVMFTDRKRFQFSYPGTPLSPVSWVRKGLCRQAVMVNHPLSLNVYAGITIHGVTRCHVVAGTSRSKTRYCNRAGVAARNITSSEYKNVLKSTLLPEGDAMFAKAGIRHWVYQQDNDPCHKCATSIIKKHNEQASTCIELLDSWPPNSPDLNPIENLWSYVESRVLKQGCKNFTDFQQTVLAEMVAVPKDILAHYYNSMPKRMRQVIEKDGEKTHY